MFPSNASGNCVPRSLAVMRVAPAVRLPEVGLGMAGRSSAKRGAAAPASPRPFAVEVGEKLVICLANTLNLDGTPSSATFDAVGGHPKAVQCGVCMPAVQRVRD